MSGKEKREWEKQRIIKTSGKNVTKLAEEYIVRFDRNQMDHLIENSIADDLFRPGELHKRLLRLQWEDIFTTNYDTLLERAANLIFRERNYQVVCSPNDIPGSIRPSSLSTTLGYIYNPLTESETYNLMEKAL